MKSVRLPRADALQVEQSKVQHYLLNLDHVDGHAKAAFLLKFGFRQSDWKTLARALQEHGRTRPVVMQNASPYGQKFEVRCTLSSPDGRNPCITSIWIQEGSNAPRLITVLPR